jgi:hypothetical protein
LAITPSAAEVAALFEMNCRREMRFFIVIPPLLDRICTILIESAKLSASLESHPRPGWWGIFRVGDTS